MNKPLNIVRRASFRGGLIGLFTGNSKRRTLERGIQQLNFDGYQVVLLEEDNWGLLGRLLSIILLIITLGLFTVEPGYLIIGEAMEPSQPGVQPRVQLRD